MDEQRLRELLARVQSGEAPIDEALQSLRTLPFEDLGFAKVDHHRALRNGFPEVIYCPGKTTPQIIAIAEKLHQRGGKVLATRAAPEVAASFLAAFPAAIYHEAARILVLSPNEQAGFGVRVSSIGNTENATDAESIQNPKSKIQKQPVPAPDTRTPKPGIILVCAAGTADLPVAEEAAVTVAELGSPVERLYDVGVAGLHRLLAHQEDLLAANVLIVVAGMEGALAYVVGGLVARPVIAVPTSVGYGSSFGGIAALLAMLNSCASGVGVVNIDNGFGAGVLAHKINSNGLR